MTFDETKFKNWEYLNDPRFIEYYAMPTIKELIGDNKRILDAGTRGGYWLHYYCKGNHNSGVGIDLGYANLDIGDPRIKILEEKIDVTYKLPFEDKEFDVSVMTAVLEHLWIPGDHFAIENLIRVTKEKIILMTPIYRDRPNDYDRGTACPEHINMFDCERFDRFLNSFGYKYEHIDIEYGYSSHIGVINLL